MAPRQALSAIKMVLIVLRVQPMLRRVPTIGMRSRVIRLKAVKMMNMLMKITTIEEIRKRHDVGLGFGGDHGIVNAVFHLVVGKILGQPLFHRLALRAVLQFERT